MPVSQVSGYYFEVDSFSMGHYHVVQSLSASSTSYHDAHYASYPNPTWRSTAVGFNCNPTLRLAGNNSVDVAKIKSHSNINNNRVQGIKQFANSNEVSIYPNPASTMLNLTLRQAQGTTANVEIYNTIGECIYRQTLQPTPTPSKEGNSFAIDVANLAEGIYNISISSNEGGMNKRVVIVR